MVDAGAEGDLGRLEGVLGGEVDVEEEDAALVRGAGRPEDGGHPLVQVVTLGPRAANTQLYNHSNIRLHISSVAFCMLNVMNQIPAIWRWV